MSATSLYNRESSPCYGTSANHDCDWAGARRFGDAICPLPRYSGGGLGWGFARSTLVLHNPHPSPPPEYRGREKKSRRQHLRYRRSVIAVGATFFKNGSTRSPPLRSMTIEIAP